MTKLNPATLSYQLSSTACLKDNERDRPSAEQLCERTASLKVIAQDVQARDRTTSVGRDKAVVEVVRSLQAQLEEKHQYVQQKDSLIAAEERQLRQHEEIQRLHQHIQRLEREKAEKERQLGRVNNQLEESENVIAEFERRVVKLE